MRTVKKGIKWLRYFINANSRHGVHSPFVYSLIEEIIYCRERLPYHDEIEKLRRELLNDKRQLSIKDFGAGSKTTSANTRKISEIASSALTLGKYGRLLGRLAKAFGQPGILELGTSLGIGTLYMAKSVTDITVTTIEGDPSIAAIARENFSKTLTYNIDLHVGEFSDVLPGLLQDNKYGMVYLDGNHKKGPTIAYFNQILPHLHNDSVVVLDDIRWSEEMEEAWRELTTHPSVTVSVDLFFQGLLFIRKEQPRENFLIRF